MRGIQSNCHDIKALIQSFRVYFWFLGYISRLKSSSFQFFWNSWGYCFFMVAFGGVIFLVFWSLRALCQLATLMFLLCVS